MRGTLRKEPQGEAEPSGPDELHRGPQDDSILWGGGKRRAGRNARATRCGARRATGRRARWGAISRAVGLGLLLLAVPVWPQAVTPKPVLIRDATVIDGTGGKVQPGVSILIERDVIQAIGKDVKAPPDATTIDAKGKYVIPGLIDARVKLGPSPANRLSREEVNVEQQVRNLRALLQAGVTTARLIQGNIADQQFYERAWNENILTSPRLVVSGPIFTVAHGHPWEEYSPIAPQARAEQLRQVSSAAEAKTMTNAAIQAGVEVVEAVYDAGMKPHPFPRLSPGELAAIVTAAHAQKRKVFCAVSTNAEAQAAVRAGCDAIEGVWQEAMSGQTAALMAEKKVFYMPVLTNQGDLINLISPDDLASYLKDPIVAKTVSKLYRDSVESPGGILGYLRKALGADPAARQGMSEQEKRAQDSVRVAQVAGVRVIVGTEAGDTLIFPGASLDRELQLLVEAGLTPGQAIIAATKNTAAALGLGATTGTIAVGKQGDLVILSADPLANIRNVEDVDTVICSGRVLGSEQLPAPAPKAAPKPAPKATGKGP